MAGERLPTAEVTDGVRTAAPDDRRGPLGLWTPTGRRVLGWLFALAAAATCSLIPLRRSSDRLADLGVYWGAVRSIFAGQPLYAFHAPNGDPFTYPPFAAVIMAPVMWLPFVAVGVLWTAGTLGALVGLGRVVASRALASPPERRGSVGWLVSLGVLLSAPGQSNLRFGQVSLALVVLCLLDVLGVLPRPVRGVLIGLAAAVKLTPLLFIVHLLVVGRRREAGTAALTFLGATAVAFVVLPSDSVAYWTREVFSTDRIGDLAALGNQSVNGLLLRAGLPPTVRPLIWALVVTLVVVAGLVRARSVALRGDRAAAAVLVGCATLAASPVSWTHHQFWPLLAGMLLVGSTGALRRGAGWALVATMTLNVTDLVAHLRLGDHAVFLAQNARVLAICLLCVLGISRTRAARDPATSRGMATGRPWSRVLVAASLTAVALVLFALVPLPTAYDPSFRPTTTREALAMALPGSNPCLSSGQAGCDTIPLFPGMVVNYSSGSWGASAGAAGFVSSGVARLTYSFAPGTAAVNVPLCGFGSRDGVRVFAFRTGDTTYAELRAYDARGLLLGDFGAKLRS